MSLIVAGIVAWLLSRTRYLIEGPNYNNEFNGYGSIGHILNGTSYSPTQYRVFIPWIFNLFDSMLLPSVNRHAIYEIIKWAATTLALASIWLLCETFYSQGYFGMAIFAILLMAQFQYDYTEQYIEVAIWSFTLIFCSTGAFFPVAVLVVAGTLNRETTVFLPLMWWATTWNIGQTLLLGLLFVIARMAPFLIYGRKKYYLELGVKIEGRAYKGRNHFWWNVDHIKSIKGLYSQTIVSILWWLLAGLALVTPALPIDLQYIPFVIPLFLCVWWFRAMFKETRVGLPLAVFIVPTLLRVL